MAGGIPSAETGVSVGQAGVASIKDVAGLQTRVDELTSQTAKTDKIAQTRRKIESEEGTPAEGMDRDPRYTSVQDELKQKWLIDHPGNDLLSEEGQNYTLGFADPKQEGPTLKSDADKIFRERYPEDAKGYDVKETTRIYEESNQDPAVRKVEQDILRSTNTDHEVQSVRNGKDSNKYREVYFAVNAREAPDAWDRFIRQYPEKAKAYGERRHPEILKALQRQEKLKDEQKRQADLLAEASVSSGQNQAESKDESSSQTEPVQTESVEEAAQASQKPEEIQVPEKVLKDPRYQEIFAQTRQHEKAQEIYYLRLAKDLIQKDEDAIKTFKQDPIAKFIYKQEFVKLRMAIKEGEEVTQEQVLANALRVQDTLPEVSAKILKDQDFRDIFDGLHNVAIGKGGDVDFAKLTKEALREYKKKKLRGLLSTIAAVVIAPIASALKETGEKTVQPAR